MKKSVVFLMLLVVFLLIFASTAMAEGVEALQQPLTWEYLATIAGAAAFTLLVVQFTKAPLDKLWKIPTRVYAYLITFVIMLLATAFTAGLTVSSTLLVACNALVAALTAYGAYEVTFAKGEQQPVAQAAFKKDDGENEG